MYIPSRGCQNHMTTLLRRNLHILLDTALNLQLSPLGRLILFLEDQDLFTGVGGNQCLQGQGNLRN